MEKVKGHHLPRGAHQCLEGKRQKVWGNVKKNYLMLGISHFRTICPINRIRGSSPQSVR